MSDVPFPSRRAVGSNRLLLASVLLVWAVVAAPLVLRFAHSLPARRLRRSSPPQVGGGGSAPRRRGAGVQCAVGAGAAVSWQPQRAGVLSGQSSLSRPAVLERVQPPLCAALAARVLHHEGPGARARPERAVGAARGHHLRGKWLAPERPHVLQHPRGGGVVAAGAGRGCARWSAGVGPGRQRRRHGLPVRRACHRGARAGAAPTDGGRASRLAARRGRRVDDRFDRRPDLAAADRRHAAYPAVHPARHRRPRALDRIHPPASAPARALGAAAFRLSDRDGRRRLPTPAIRGSRAVLLLASLRRDRRLARRLCLALEANVGNARGGRPARGTARRSPRTSDRIPHPRHVSLPGKVPLLVRAGEHPCWRVGASSA